MATLKDIRKRISSVKNTQKITRAMKMVSAAKLRRAQQALMGARPHAQLLAESLARLIPLAGVGNHPLLKRREAATKAATLVITSDRGLCGGFNGNLLRKVEVFSAHEASVYESMALATVGRKGRDYYKAKKIELASTEFLGDEAFTFEKARELAGSWLEKYEAGEFDVFYLAYNSFKSAISQVPTIRQVFPLEIEIPEGAENSQVVWEGDPKALMNDLLHRHVATLFYLAILESRASELGARMSAMESATNNANDMIGSLTLKYNRARQSAITTELMDIVNGAEALG